MPTVAKRSGISRRGVTGVVGRARRARPPAVQSRLRYIESSALVAALLEGDVAVVRKQAPGTKVVTSALTFSEASRAIIRARVMGRLTIHEEQVAVQALRTFERRCFVLAVDQAVLDRARRLYPVEPIRTLDAIHLATAEVLGEAPALVTIVTRDDRVIKNAEALGYRVE